MQSIRAALLLALSSSVFAQTQLNLVTQGKGVTFPSSQIVGISDTQTLTNKSINASEINSGTFLAARFPALSGDLTSTAGTTVLTLNTVNSNVGTFGSASQCVTITVNAKGLITAASQQACAGGGGGSGNATSIQGTAVSATTPSTGQVLEYNGTNYLPTTLFTLSGGLGTSVSGTSALAVNVSMGFRTTAATIDSLANTDCGGLVVYTSASAVAVSLPQASLGGNFLAGCPLTVRTGAGAATITTSGSSSINGGSSLTVSANKGCLVVSDGTNFQIGNCN